MIRPIKLQKEIIPDELFNHLVEKFGEEIANKNFIRLSTKQHPFMKFK